MSVSIESNPSWIKDVANDDTLRLIMDNSEREPKGGHSATALLVEPLKNRRNQKEEF